MGRERDWKWQWTSNNVIQIYEPTDSLSAITKAQVWDIDHEGEHENLNENMEATAEFICKAVNAYNPKE